MNDGSIVERLEEFFQPGWRRVDHRALIGTGELDATTFAEVLAAVDLHTRSTELAVRGELLLLSRGTTSYGPANESSFLVLSEIDAEGRQRRSDLYDDHALDEAVAEMDRRWIRTLTDEERTTLRVTREFGGAFVEQDHAVFDRILHPTFTAVDHGMLQAGALDRTTWHAIHRDRHDVFGRGRLLIDVLELPSPHVVLCRTIQTGTSGTGVAWELADWNVLQVDDGKVIRCEVLDADPERAQADRARGIADELSRQGTPPPLANRAVHALSAVAAAWNAGESGSRFCTTDFEWRDRRNAATGAAPPEDLVSTALSGTPQSIADSAVGDVLLAYDLSFALLTLRISNVLGRDDCSALVAVACDADGQLDRASVFELDQEEAARRELTTWWAATLPAQRMEVNRLAVAFGESWVAPTSQPLGDIVATDFRLVDGRTLGLGDLDRPEFVRALVGREDDGTVGAPLPSRVRFVSDEVLVFRAANRGITPGTGVEWEEIACNVFVTDGAVVRRVEMFDEHQWDAAVARAREIAERVADEGDADDGPRARHGTVGE